MKIRLGRISYANMAPVFFRLDADVEEILGVPTELNRALVAGEIDIAPISSIAYARHAEQLRLMPRLCVSSEGAVDSIQLVSRIAPTRLSVIAVTPESATSVVLIGQMCRSCMLATPGLPARKASTSPSFSAR